MLKKMPGQILEKTSYWLCFATSSPSHQYNEKLQNGQEDSIQNGINEGGSPKETSCITISVYSAVVIAIVCVFIVLGRDYIKYLLLSLEETNLLISIAVFGCLFTIVSFPMTWGYILLNIAAGYLYGLLLGIAVVMMCALCGVTIAHFIIKKCMRNFVMRRLTNSSVRAIMKVVESDNGFKVVVLSRLTPIPFGLQNALYALSSISYPKYIGASALGMLPSQGMHAYIGSTLRSMEEVISSSGNSTTAYCIFGAQLAMILVLLLYVVRRARNELDRAVQNLPCGVNNDSEQDTSKPAPPEVFYGDEEHNGEVIIVR